MVESNRGLGTLVRDRTFLLLQARGTAASVGYTVYLVTILWLTYRLTGGIFLAGVVVGVEIAVYTLSFLTGPLIDRIPDKRWVYVVCYPIQAATSVALGVTYSYGVLTVPLLLVLVVVLAGLWDLTWTADSAATRLLFGKGELFAVSGLGAAIGGAVNIAMYFTAGLTIALFGAAGGSYLYAVLLLAGAALALFLAIPTPNASTDDYWHGFVEGWNHYRGDSGKPLRHLAVLQLVYGFFTAAPTLLLTLYVARSFGGSASIYSELFVAYIVGGILIGIALGRLNPRAFVGWVGAVSLLATGAILFVAEAVVGSVGLSLIAWFIVGVVTTSRATAFWNYTQGRFAPEVQGRISGNSYVFPGVSAAVGAFTIGVLSTTWSPNSLTDFTAVGFIGSALVAFALSGTRTLAF
jgi:hypothetical protein